MQLAKLFCFILLFLSFLFNAYSQTDLSFARYTSGHGLVNNDILTICQDNLGFIWFGTKDGCSRFDGINFKNFKYINSNSESKGLGWVNKIITDKNGDLWLALAGYDFSLLKYNYSKEQFVDYGPKIRNLLPPKGTKLDFWNIFIDCKGFFWFDIADYGCIKYNPFEHKVFNKSQEWNLSNKLSINDFYEDDDNNLWFATTKGLYIYNSNSDTLIQQFHSPDDSSCLSSDNCNCLLQDSDNQTWIGTNNGLYKLLSVHDKKYTFKCYTYNEKNKNSLSDNQVYCLAEDKNNNLLIGTVKGLCLLIKKEGKIYRYFHEETDNESINSNLIRTLYIDKDKNIWTGTNQGAAKIQHKNFKSYSYSSAKKGISHNKIQNICEATNQDIWLASPIGIDVYNPLNNSFRFLTGISNSKNGLSGAPLSFFSQENKGMWIGTWNGGYSFYDYSSGKITTHKSDSINNVFAILIDKKNRLWIGDHYNGVYVYKTSGEFIKSFQHNENNESSLSSNKIWNIIEDSEYDIWVGTLRGVNLLHNFDKGSFKRFLVQTTINCIRETSNRNFWIGTNRGLFLFNKNTQKYRVFNKSSGLPANTILGILEDSKHNLWLSTTAGFVKFYLDTDSVPVITTYHYEEGLTIGDFNVNSCAKTSTGHMLFGGNNGFCSFNSSEIYDDTLAPEVVFTGLEVGNKKVGVGEAINNQVILNQSINLTKEIALNYKNNNFAIQFSGLQYNMPNHNTYAYRLNGYDTDGAWHFTDASDRKIEYMNLSGGTYEFNVRAANSYGIWSNKPAKLRIIILPPWWKSDFFTALWILLVVIIVVVFVKIRTYRLQKQKQILERTVEKRTHQLKEMNIVLQEGKEEIEQQAQTLTEMNRELIQTNTNLETKTKEVEEMAKKVHEADQFQLRLFTNISHEFRTPLSLIIGPVEKYMSVKQLKHVSEWGTIYNQLQLVYKNAKRLLKLINEILDFRKLDQGIKRLNLTNNNITIFIQEVILAFSPLAEAKQIQLKLVETRLIASLHNFWFDPDIMEKILYNLISNAIKYTPEGGEIVITIGVAVETRCIASLQKNQLVITISDTGIGIKPENIDKIFDRFYRVKTRLIASQPEGTGIGLAYTKELVELHKGQISVSSELNKGTTFKLTFHIAELLTIYNNTNKLNDSINRNKSLNFDNIVSLINEDSKLNQSTYNTEQKELSDISSAVIPDTNRKTVLIVEDNTDLRHFVKNELVKLYNVIEADNGEEGWEMTAQYLPGMVISDIMMPLMNGFDLCKRIKTDEITSHIPVILLTAKTGDENIIKGLNTGADDYIIKPFNIDILIKKTENLFSFQQRLKDKFRNSLDIEASEIVHSPVDEQFLNRAIRVVYKNLQNPSFENDDFVESMNCSRSVVYRKIKNLTDMSVSEFIRAIRLKRAAQLFLDGNDNITEVCYLVGFKQPSILSRNFSKMFNKSPRDFIKDIKEKNG